MSQEAVKNSNVFQIDRVTKAVKVGRKLMSILEPISFKIQSGTLVAITGPNGGGKTTLANIMVGLEKPSSGRVIFDGVDIFQDLLMEERINLRKQKIGIIYQHPAWISSLNLIENLAFPLWIDGVDCQDALERASQVLKGLMLSKLATRQPSRLSGAEQQISSIARALVHQPDVIIADEPTSSLDSINSERIFDYLKQLVARDGKTVIMITQKKYFASQVDQVIMLKTEHDKHLIDFINN